MSDTDAMKAALAQFVDWRTQRLDFAGLQAATVRGQNADGTLEISFEDARFPQLSGVKLASPWPSTQVKVASGARVFIGWIGCNPDLPIALGWDTGTTTEVDINGGSTPVAKEGSATTGHLHTGTAGPYPVTLVLATDTIAVGAGSPTVKVP